MANATAGGAQAIPHQGCFDASAVKDVQDTLCNGAFVALGGASDAIPFPGNIQINTAGVDSATLAAPIAGPQPAGDDGKTIFVVDNGGHAHTLTTPANAIVNSKHILTFNGTKGSCCEAVAMSGVWVPTILSGVAVS